MKEASLKNPPQVSVALLKQGRAHPGTRTGPSAGQTGQRAWRDFFCPDAQQPCPSDCPRISIVVHELSESLGLAIDAKSPFAKNHSDEVAVVAHSMALAMGLPPQAADLVHIAGHLHDIGKIGVPDAVLTKPGPLTREEWAQMRRHPEIGAAILRPVQTMREMGVPEIVHSHHERYDGQGYPRGLRNRAIPLGARLIAVADTLSAMLQHRPYRGAKKFEEACAEIGKCSGTQFDPRVVEAFMSVRDKAHQSIVQLREACCFQEKE